MDHWKKRGFWDVGFIRVLDGSQEISYVDELGGWQTDKDGLNGVWTDFSLFCIVVNSKNSIIIIS